MSQAVTGANDGQKRIKKTDNVWGWLVKWIPLWLTPNHLSAMRMFLVLPISASPLGLDIWVSMSPRQNWYDRLTMTRIAQTT